MIKCKTVAQMKKENDDAARALPVETKKIFWKALMQDHKSVGESRKLAGIEDIMVAAALVFQLHVTVNFPMRLEDIK